MPYQSADKHTEDGFAINSFERQAKNAEFSVNDRVEEVKHTPGLKKWDRLRKKMVSVQDPRAGKIRTESGIWIPATYKTGRYDDWKEKTKIEEQVQREYGDETTARTHAQKYPTTRWGRNAANQEAKKHTNASSSELKKPEQIVRQRMRLEFIKNKLHSNTVKKAANRKRHDKQQKSKSRGRK